MFLNVFKMLLFHYITMFPPALESQLSDLPPTMLKMDFAAVPLAQT